MSHIRCTNELFIPIFITLNASLDKFERFAGPAYLNVLLSFALARMKKPGIVVHNPRHSTPTFVLFNDANPARVKQMMRHQYLQPKNFMWMKTAAAGGSGGGDHAELIRNELEQGASRWKR